MSLALDYQQALSKVDRNYIPSETQLVHWVELVLGAVGKSTIPVELTIRVVDDAEMQALNHQYRHKDALTNVLSFPFEAPPGTDIPLLGDIIICASVVQKEAEEQAKTPEQHWAHMVIHGTLHLLGFDHISPTDAEQMEALERQVLQALNFPDPYELEARTL